MTPDTLLAWQRALIARKYDGHLQRGPGRPVTADIREWVVRTTWQEFLTAHRDVLAAADFFTVEVWTAGGLTRFAVLFVIDLATRRVEVAGIVPERDRAWVIQCGRQVTDPVDGCLRGKRFLLHDRDPRFRACAINCSSQPRGQLMATARSPVVHGWVDC